SLRKTSMESSISCKLTSLTSRGRCCCPITCLSALAAARCPPPASKYTKSSSFTDHDCATSAIPAMNGYQKTKDLTIVFWLRHAIVLASAIQSGHAVRFARTHAPFRDVHHPAAASCLPRKL